MAREAAYRKYQLTINNPLVHSPMVGATVAVAVAVAESLK